MSRELPPHIAQAVRELSRTARTLNIAEVAKTAARHQAMLDSLRDSPIWRAAGLDAAGVGRELAAMAPSSILQRTGLSPGIASLAMEPALPLGLANIALSNSLFGSQALEALKGIGPNSPLSESIASLSEKLRMAGVGTELSGMVRALTATSVPDWHLRFKDLGLLAGGAESLLASIRLDHLGDAIGVRDPAPLRRATMRLNASYYEVTTAMVEDPEFFSEFPSFARYPVHATYSHARILDAATTRERDEEEADTGLSDAWAGAQEEARAVIERELPLLSPELMKCWTGAFQAKHLRRSDWARHASSSIRTVLEDTLKLLAPPDVLRKSPGFNKKEHETDAGAVKRDYQITWILSAQREPSNVVALFTAADLRAMLKTIATLSDAVHRADNGDCERIFDRLAVKVTMSLQFLLELPRRV